MSFVFSTCTENYNCDYNNRSYNFVDKALKMFMSGCFLSTYSIVEEALLHCARVLALFCLVLPCVDENLAICQGVVNFAVLWCGQRT